jgi:hypothetical protein
MELVIVNPKPQDLTLSDRSYDRKRSYNLRWRRFFEGDARALSLAPVTVGNAAPLHRPPQKRLRLNRLFALCLSVRVAASMSSSAALMWSSCRPLVFERSRRPLVLGAYGGHPFVPGTGRRWVDYNLQNMTLYDRPQQPGARCAHE